MGEKEDEQMYKKMKILYITSTPLEYSSSANFRNIALIKGLIECGHEVSTLTTRPQKESECYDETILNVPISNRYYVELGKIHSKLTSTKNISSLDKNLEQVELLKVAEKKNFEKKLKRKLYKIYTSLHLYDSRKSEAKSVSHIDFKGEVFDVIISSSDPKSSHIYAERLLKKFPNIAKRWIQYWGDPFTGDINRNSVYPEFIIGIEEKRLIKKCDKAVYVSPFTADYIRNRYFELSHKIAFIPVGYSKEKIYPPNEGSKIKLCYCGDYRSRDRNIEPLLKAVENLPSDYLLTIAGNSDIKLVSDEKFVVLPRVGREKVEAIESQSDIIVCICNKNGTQIPGKIYHAAATNRAILILLDGDRARDIKKYFEKYNRFYFCDNNVEAIKEFLQTVRIEDLNSAPCKELSAKVIASDFLK